MLTAITQISNSPVSAKMDILAPGINARSAILPVLLVVDPEPINALHVHRVLPLQTGTAELHAALVHISIM
jgi:hypothetical protein